jgi:hypothetical protein
MTILGRLDLAVLKRVVIYKTENGLNNPFIAAIATGIAVQADPQDDLESIL